MDEATALLFLIYLFIAGATWLPWYARFWSERTHEIRRNTAWLPLQLVPLICAALITYVLTQFAASDVRSDTTEIVMYLTIGIGWVGIGVWLSQYLGISTKMDVIERRNVAALLALAGALVGVTLCYSGGNIGEGPGPEVVLTSAGLASGVFMVIWWLFTLITEVDYAITIGRNMSAGLRLGGLLIAVGLILGRAVAGNWVSFEATLIDFVRYGWPALALLIVACIVERAAKPTVERPVLPVVWAGILPLTIYVGGAAAYLLLGTFAA